MKLKEILLTILITVGSLQAQVGIGTNEPKSRLDVNGNITIGFEENNPGKEGMVRWSEEKNCLESHNGEKWNCLEYKITEGIGMPLLNLNGGENLKFDKDTGWSNNDKANDSVKNILKLNIRSKESKEPSLYDPQSGTITADQDGSYKLAYRVRLYNNPAEGTFDGTAGGFATWITINNEQASLRQLQLVYRGAKVEGGYTHVDSNDNQIIYLRKNDKLHVRFYTYGTWNMNSETKNIYISKSQSYIMFWRL